MLFLDLDSKCKQYEKDEDFKKISQKYFIFFKLMIFSVKERRYKTTINEITKMKEKSDKEELINACFEKSEKLVIFGYF